MEKELKPRENMNAGEALLADARELRQCKEDYREVFLGSAAGKRVLLDLMQACAVLRHVHVKGDIEATARREGARDLALLILDQLDLRGFEGIMALEREGVKLLNMGEMA